MSWGQIGDNIKMDLKGNRVRKRQLDAEETNDKLLERRR
jgi:hypothetical protein